MKWLRITLVLLICDWILGYPGLGIETRTGTTGGAMDWVYTVVGLAILLALTFTWFRPVWARRLAMAVGGAAVLLAILDMVGATSGAPAPAAMIAVDLGGIVIGSLIVWTARPVLRGVAAGVQKIGT